MTALQGHSLFLLGETDSTTSLCTSLCIILSLLGLTLKLTVKPFVQLTLIRAPPYTQITVTHHAVRSLMLLKVKTEDNHLKEVDLLTPKLK